VNSPMAEVRMADVDFRRRSRSLRAAEAVMEVVVAMFYVYIYFGCNLCVYVVQRVSFCFIYFILSNVKSLFFIYTQTSLFLSLSLLVVCMRITIDQHLGRRS